ncbi:MAG: hypothetical protein LYZ70_04285, partial [Nitrososphaerales archaeon]|nr:hypothetical protein [Nitrososphaerales archaeon]
MTVTATAAATTTETFDVGLLRKGLFVGISFISSRKGMKNRAPKEELEAEFRELNDYALPKDMRQELGNLIARRQYLYSRYSIPIESMKGHFVPNDNLAEFLEKAALLEKDVKRFAEKIVERRPEINERLSQFSAKYGGMEPIPDDPEYIRREYGKFTVRINSVTIATSEFLGSMPELREKMRSELMEQVNRNAKELEARIRGEVAADLKKRVATFLNRLAELKRKVDKEGKGLHGNTVKGLTEDIQRLSALTS